MADPNTSSYDHAAFMENLCGLEDLARDSVQAFSRLLPKMLLAIEEALNDRDAKRLEVAAHTLKGTVSNFFAHPARELAGRLEAIGNSGNLQGAEPVFDLLKQELVRLQASLELAFPPVRVA